MFFFITPSSFYIFDLWSCNKININTISLFYYNTITNSQHSYLSQIVHAQPPSVWSSSQFTVSTIKIVPAYYQHQYMQVYHHLYHHQFYLLHCFFFSHPSLCPCIIRWYYYNTNTQSLTVSTIYIKTPSLQTYLPNFNHYHTLPIPTT